MNLPPGQITLTIDGAVFNTGTRRLDLIKLYGDLAMVAETIEAQAQALGKLVVLAQRAVGIVNSMPVDEPRAGITRSLSASEVPARLAVDGLMMSLREADRTLVEISRALDREVELFGLGLRDQQRSYDGGAK